MRWFIRLLRSGRGVKTGQVVAFGAFRADADCSGGDAVTAKFVAELTQRAQR